MKKYWFIYYIIAFVITWLLFIFLIKKEEFSLEYRELGTTSAIVTDIEDVERETGNEHKSYVYYETGYVYSYAVNGKRYTYGDIPHNEAITYKIRDKISIEYVKSNPSISRIKGNNYNNNFFYRYILEVVFVSFLVMIGLKGIDERIAKIHRKNKKS